jgi:glycosyltransferase involved in cell wall biosynthesis
MGRELTRSRTVVFVSHTGVWGGGAEIVLQQVMETARDSGYRVVLAAPAGELMDRLRPQTDDACVLPVNPPRRTTSLLRALGMILGWGHATVVLTLLLRRSHASAVYANSGVAAVLAIGASRNARVPLIWHQHDIVPLRVVNRLVLRPTGLASRRIVAVSAPVSSSLARLGVPIGSLAVVHNGVRAEFMQCGLDREQSRRDLNLPANNVILAMGGRLVPYKGHWLFLEALAALIARGHDVVAAIAGTTPEYVAPDVDPFPGYEADLRGRAAHADLAGRVFFLGQQPDTRAFLAASDVLVAPSQDEPFPLIVLEAMAAGRVVVASDSGGHPEAIEDEATGLLFATGSLSALVSALERMVTDEALRGHLASAASARVKDRFTPEVFARNVAHVLAEVVGQ